MMNDFKLIDLHTHILPNIDNGSRSIEETYDLLKEAKKVRFHEIVLTSHYIKNYFETEHDGRKVWLETLKNKFTEFNDMRFYIGSEIYLTDEIIPQLEQYKASTINNTCYILVSLDEKNEMGDIYDRIEEIQSKKLIPILSHPEKCEYIQKDPNILVDYVKKGAYVQANYGSFTGMYGKCAKHLVEDMLRNNLIHFLGTDVHRKETIYSQIPEILKQIEDEIGKKELKKLCYENPKKVLENKKIEKKNIELFEYSVKQKTSYFFSNILDKIRN